MANLKFDAVLENAKVLSGFREIQSAVQQTASAAQKEGKTIQGIIDNISQSMTIAIGGWSIGRFANQMLQVRGQFQQTEMAFKTMLQSEEKAKNLMDQLIHTAAVTPFGVEDVTEGAKQLLAYNTAAEKVNDTLVGLGDIAAGMGLRLSDLVMLYGTTITKGKMDTMDLRQFLNRGIPIADALAKVMKLNLADSINQVSKAIKKGKVTSEIFDEAIKTMTADGSKFGGLMEAQSQTITGQISNIEDAIEQMFNELGRSQEGVINSGLDIVSRLVESWQTVGKVLITVVSAYGAYKAAVIAMIAIEKAHIAMNSVKAWISLARSITSAKDAMALFNIKTKASPIGLIVGLIASAVAYFNLFGDKTEDAAEATERFGEDAAKATQNVDSLLAILKATDSRSKAHKDSVKELARIYSNYGIEIQQIAEDESNLNDVKEEEIQKSKELIEQIKLESVERNRANAISKANTSYNNSIDSAYDDLQSSLIKKLGQSKGMGATVAIQDIVSQETIDRLVTLKEVMASNGQTTKEYQSALQQVKAIESELQRETEKFAGKIGITGFKLLDTQSIMLDYVRSITKAGVAYSTNVKAINQAADATENFNGKSSSTTKRTQELQKQLQGAGEDVTTLYGRVKRLMEDFQNIKFTIDFDAKIPSWMQKMDIPQLGKLGKFFSALAKDMAQSGKKSATVNGKVMSIDEIAQRGWDYTSAANAKQEEAEKEAKRKAQKEAEVDEKELKKKAAERKKLQEELNKEVLALRQRNVDDEIELMQEGTEKRIAEIRNNYTKQIAEIKNQENEFKKKNKESGLTSGGLTNEQRTALATATTNAEKERAKQIEDINKELHENEVKAMLDYLKEYGTIQEKLLALDKEYSEERKKILASPELSNEQKQWQLEALGKRHQSEEASVNAQSMAMNIDWSSTFQGVGNVLRGIARETLSEVTQYMKTNEFKNLSPEAKKSYTDLRKNLNEQAGNATSPFNFGQWDVIAKQTVTYQESVQRLKKATTAHNKAIEELKAAEENLANATDEKSQELAQIDVLAAKEKVKTTGEKQTTAESNAQQAEEDLTDSTEKAVNGMNSFQTALSNISSGSLKGFADGVTMLITSLGSGSNQVGKTLGELGGKIGGLVGAILSILDALGDDPSGFIDSVLSKLIDAIGGLMEQIASAELAEMLVKDIAKLLGTLIQGLLIDTTTNALKFMTFGKLDFTDITQWGSNAKEVAEKTEELTKENERLRESVDNLKDEMANQGGTKAYTTYTEAIKDQERLQSNTMEILKAQMSYHAAHHSNAYYWGLDSGDYSTLNDILAQYSKKNPNAKISLSSVFSLEDIYKLTPEQMAYIRTYNIDLWNKMLEQGEYDKSEYWDAYADLAGEMEEITEAFKESLTQVSFDSLRSSFIETLSDMDANAEDFSDNFSEMLMKSVLNARIADLLEDDLEAFYNKWAEYAESDNELTDAEIEALRKEWDALAQRGLDIRDEASKITGYTGDSSSQEASSGGWESMGQDTADELNGRFTALQIAGESIATNMANAIAYLENIVSAVISSNGAVMEIRNMMVMTNSYLEDIARYNKNIFVEFGDKLDNIHKRLKEM